MSKIELPKFEPSKYFAKCCKTIIFSSYPGEFKRCKCGKCFVDQTRYYLRCGADDMGDLVRICNFCSLPCETEYCCTNQ